MNLGPNCRGNLFMCYSVGREKVLLLGVCSQPHINMLELLKRRLSAGCKMGEVAFIFVLSIVSVNNSEMILRLRLHTFSLS